MADDIVTSLRESAGWIKDVEHESWFGTADLQNDAADEIERLRAMVDWFVDGRLWDFEDHPEYGPGLAYDGIIKGEPLPDDIVQAFRQAARLEKERIFLERAEAARRATVTGVPTIAEAIERGMTVDEIEAILRG